MANVKTNAGAGKRTESKTTQSSAYKKKVETVVPQEVVEKNQETSDDVKAEAPQVLTEVEMEEKVQEVPDEVGSEDPQVLTEVEVEEKVSDVEDANPEAEDVTEEIKTESRTGVFVAQHLTPSSRIRGTYGATKFVKV